MGWQLEVGVTGEGVTRNVCTEGGDQRGLTRGGDQRDQGLTRAGLGEPWMHGGWGSYSSCSWQTCASAALHAFPQAPDGMDTRWYGRDWDERDWNEIEDNGVGWKRWCCMVESGVGWKRLGLG